MSLRADAEALLDAWQAPDEDQARLRLDYLAHLGAHSDAMWRECRPAHLTASTLVMAPDGSEVLLVQHAKVGLWLQTGGHCERTDRTLLAAAMREATEETGLAELRMHPAPLRLDRHPAPCGAKWHLDVQFVAFAPDGAAVATNWMIDGEDPVAWFPVDQLPERTDDAVRRLVRTAVERLHEVVQ